MRWQQTAGVAMAVVLGRVLSFVLPSGLNVPPAGLRRALCASSSLGYCSPGNRAMANRAYGGVVAGNASFLQQGRGGRGGSGTTRGFRGRVPLMVSAGDVAGVEYSLRKEDGSPFETPFDQGRVRLVVGKGGFAPFLHEAVMQMEPGDDMEVKISPKDAFGEYDPELTATLGMDLAPGELRVGMVLQLWTGQKARVTKMTQDNFTIDWNPEDAGTSLVMDVKVLDADKVDAVLKKATFAGGCFWGLELAFQRAKGVVSTKTGYAQGHVHNPSYSDVCSGKTGHTEAVQVLFDPKETTFENLLRVFFDRHDPTQVDGQGNDKGTQYRAGVYFHDDDQRKVAEKFFEKEKALRGLRKIATELEEVQEFFDAEEEHQQYLQKGGQDARKDAQETIRCYG